MKTLENPLEMVRIVVFLCTALVLAQCVTPINSSFESARTIEPGDVEITGGYDRYSSGADGESDFVNSNITVRAGVGLTDRMDMKLRYTRLMPADVDGDEGAGVNYFHIAPKFSFIPKYLAFSLPVGAYFGGGSSWVTSPKLLGTYPHKSNKFDATLGFKADVFFRDWETYLGFTLGMGFSKDLDKWAIRPEIGYMIDPGETGHSFSWGLGLVYVFQGNK